MLNQLIGDLKKTGEAERINVFMKFFKTKKGEYGEGDKFLGITVPETRKVAKKYKNLNLKDLQKLLKNEIHECRLCALMILRLQYEKAKSIQNKKRLINFYLKNTKYINNWDLVDLSSPYILGSWFLALHLSGVKLDILYKFARSESLWEKRIAIISTYTFIKNNQFEDTIKISEILLTDKHDLIHKAVGWMLREIGKRDQNILEKFLQRHSQKMPRTMLRYAIEKFSKEKRKYYLTK